MKRIAGKFFFFFVVACALAPAGGAQTRDWLPIPPEDLAMKDNPAHPGDHAMILFREEYTEDQRNFATYYYRIKILTEEGKNRANVEVVYLKPNFRVDDIKARTIGPDGTVVEFNGQVFDRAVVKVRGVRVNAKTFTLPDVQVGSIIEYRYRLRWDETLLPRTTWTVQDDLFTREARFALKRYVAPTGRLGLYWVSFHLPPGVSANHNEKDGHVRLEVKNIPPFRKETFMPPEGELKMRVAFYYTSQNFQSSDQFWQNLAKARSEYREEYMNKRKAMEQALAEIVSPTDTPDQKLRKIYARVQQLRNLSFERSKTGQEEKREKLKDNNHVEDAWKRGYGYGVEINWLFTALARAAGFDTQIVLISKRNEYFFSKELLDSGQMGDEIVVVRAGGKEYYLDPGTAFAPFGLLAWFQTGTQGMEISKNGGRFLTTPQPVSATALTERNAKLKLDAEGTLNGKVEVVFHGHQALRRRLEALDSDDAERRKDMEDDIKAWLPGNAKVDSMVITGWEGSNQSLRVEFDLTIEGFAASTGRRLLVPWSVFHAGRRQPFEHSTRIHPVYFSYPYSEEDTIDIELPEGMTVESLPQPRQETPGFAVFQLAGQKTENKLQLRRQFVMEGFYFRKEYYSTLRDFYERVRAGDEQQVVLQTSAVAQR